MNKDKTRREVLLAEQNEDLREAVRVLAAEVSDWRDAWEAWDNSKDPHAYISDRRSTVVDTDHIASAALKDLKEPKE